MNTKYIIVPVLAIIVSIVIFSLCGNVNTQHNSIPIKAPSMVLDPVLNISSNSNLITGLTTTAFTGGNDFNLSFTPTNASQTQNTSISLPKYAVVSDSNYNITGHNFTGNIATTPTVSGVTNTGTCTTPHNNFTGYVIVNGQNKSFTNYNFIGGLYSATGSCTASLTTSNSCGSPGTPYPSGSCQASYSCSTGTNNYYSTTGTFSSNCGTSNYEYLSSSSESGYTTSCSNTGTNTLSCGDGASYSLPSPSITSTTTQSAHLYTSYRGNPGTEIFCPNTVYSSAGDCSMLNYLTDSLVAGPIADGASYLAPGTTSSFGTATLEASCGSSGSIAVAAGTYYQADGLTSCDGYTSASGAAAWSMIEALDSSWGTNTLANPITSYCSGGCTPTAAFPNTEILVVETSTSNYWRYTFPQNDYFSLVNTVFGNQCTTSGGCQYYGNGYTWLYSSSPPITPAAPYYTVYDCNYYSGSVVGGSTTGSFSNPGIGMCYQSNTVNSNSCASCSPSSGSVYSCLGSYNSSTPNKCLSSSSGVPISSGQITYQTSCPSPGSGTISSVTAIPNSCFSTYNNTATANITQKVDGTSVYTNTGTFTGTDKINITSALKSYIASCTASGSNCTIPITTSSSKPGVMEFSNLYIPFSYNVSALYSSTYNVFNYTQQGMAITPNTTVGYGSTITAEHPPYKTIAVHGFDSSVNCQMMIGNSIYDENVNGSGVCPFEINLTTSQTWKSFDNGSTSSIYLFNKHVKPITQTFGTAYQNTSKVSTPGVTQYITVPITIKSNASDYKVTSSINTSILTTNVSGFKFNQAKKYYTISNGSTTIDLGYSGDLVTSKQVTEQGNYTIWKQNTVTIDDTWNNTSPYNFSNLYKVYSLGAGAKVQQCKVNGTEVINTSICKVVTNTTGVFVEVNDSLNAHQWVDPTIVAEAPNITVTESGASQTSSSITCVVPLGESACSPTASNLAPTFSQTAYFTNTGGFTYPSINLSATIPAYNQIESGTVLVSYGGVVQTPYYVNLTSGVINWTTTNFMPNSTEQWTITYKGVALTVEFTNESVLGKFEWNIVGTAPRGLAYTNFYFTMDTPITTAQYACTSTSLTVCTQPNTQSYLGQGLNINVIPDVTTQKLQIQVSQIPANGSVNFVPVGILGKPVVCNVTNTTQTPVIVGQVIQVNDRITCTNPNTNSTQVGTLPFTYNFQLPPNAFGIIANQTTVNIEGLQPLVSTGLSFAKNYSYIPLSSTYNASENKTFIVQYKVQPLAITYKPLHPQTFYTNLPALSTVNISISNNAPIPIQEASYNIPIEYGFNASFIVNGTEISNESNVVGSYPITFTNVPGNKTEYGVIYYFTPTTNVTIYPPYQEVANSSSLVTFSPFAVTSVSPIPMANVTLIANVLQNVSNSVVGACSTVVKAYLTTSPADTSGKSLAFSCLKNSDNRVISVDIGSLNLGSTDFVVLYSNSTVSAQLVSTPTTPSINPFITFLQSVWNGIVKISKDISSFFGGLHL